MSLIFMIRVPASKKVGNLCIEQKIIYPSVLS